MIDKEALSMLKDLARAIELLAETCPSPGRASTAKALCDKTQKRVIAIHEYQRDHIPEYIVPNKPV